MTFPVRCGPQGVYELRVKVGSEPSGRLWPDGYFSVARKPVYRWAEVSRGAALEALDRHSALGLVRLRNHHKGMDSSTPPHRKPGDKGITRFGRRMVRAGSRVLDLIKGRDKLSFATLTLPEMSGDDDIRVLAHWGRIVQVYLQSLRRYFARKNRDFEYVAVTEIQPKRFSTTKGSGLHLHLLFIGGRPGSWTVPPSALRGYWRKAVSAFVHGRYVWGASENVVSVRGTTGGYLAKYMSKGVEAAAALAERFPLCPIPAQWWSIAASVRERIKQLVVESPLICEVVTAIYASKESEGVFSLVNETVVSLEQGGLFVGLTGYLTRSGYDFVLGVIE